MCALYTTAKVLCERVLVSYTPRMSVKVFGHKSPDTDTTGSAILWAWYLNTHTSQEAEAYLLGELNKETSFVLNRWDIPQPSLLESGEEGGEGIILDTN